MVALIASHSPKIADFIRPAKARYRTPFLSRKVRESPFGGYFPVSPHLLAMFAAKPISVNRTVAPLDRTNSIRHTLSFLGHASLRKDRWAWPHHLCLLPLYHIIAKPDFLRPSICFMSMEPASNAKTITVSS